MRGKLSTCYRTSQRRHLKVLWGTGTHRKAYPRQVTQFMKFSICYFNHLITLRIWVVIYYSRMGLIGPCEINLTAILICLLFFTPTPVILSQWALLLISGQTLSIFLHFFLWPTFLSNTFFTNIFLLIMSASIYNQ